VPSFRGSIPRLAFNKKINFKGKSPERGYTMYTIEQAEEHFRENLRNLIGEWETKENFYENLICSFDSEYLDKNGNSPDYSDYAVETGDFRNVPYSSAQTLEVYDENISITIEVVSNENEYHETIYKVTDIY
jgi:hypothetical protein